jgi:hypothetical protein
MKKGILYYKRKCLHRSYPFLYQLMLECGSYASLLEIEMLEVVEN